MRMAKTVCRLRQSFGTTTSDLLKLDDWLMSYSGTLVGMESTGVYWKPDRGTDNAGSTSAKATPALCAAVQLRSPAHSCVWRRRLRSARRGRRFPRRIRNGALVQERMTPWVVSTDPIGSRSEEHTSELQ